MLLGAHEAVEGIVLGLQLRRGAGVQGLVEVAHAPSAAEAAIEALPIVLPELAAHHLVVQLRDTEAVIHRIARTRHGRSRMDTRPQLRVGRHEAIHGPHAHRPGDDTQLMVAAEVEVQRLGALGVVPEAQEVVALGPLQMLHCHGCHPPAREVKDQPPLGHGSWRELLVHSTQLLAYRGLVLVLVLLHLEHLAVVRPVGVLLAVDLQREGRIGRQASVEPLTEGR